MLRQGSKVDVHARRELKQEKLENILECFKNSSVWIARDEIYKSGGGGIYSLHSLKPLTSKI